MSRIKGKYVQSRMGTCVGDVRWLDPKTGLAYNSEYGGHQSHYGFQPLPDGDWQSGPWVFRPDKVEADWYLWCFNPTHSMCKYFTSGPYTEQGARSKATDNAAKYPKNTYAVYQILPGNTVKVVPPTPPQPEVIWS